MLAERARRDEKVFYHIPSSLATVGLLGSMTVPDFSEVVTPPTGATVELKVEF